MHKHILNFFARYQQQMIIYISDDNMESGQSDVNSGQSGSSSHLGTVTHAETVSLSCAVVQNWLCHTFGA